MRRPHLRDAPAVPPPPPGYELRTFGGETDLEPLAATLTAAFGEPWGVEAVRRVLTESPDVRAVYVAAHGGRPVATASSRYLPERFGGSGIVHWVGTHPEHAGRGLGLALVARVLDDFAERGYPDAVLQTDDFRLPAIRMYLKLGFTPVYEVEGEDHRARWSAVFERLLVGEGVAG